MDNNNMILNQSSDQKEKLWIDGYQRGFNTKKSDDIKKCKDAIKKLEKLKDTPPLFNKTTQVTYNKAINDSIKILKQIIEDL